MRDNPGKSPPSDLEIQDSRYFFSQEAEGDTASAFRWYNEQHSGLGIEFLDMLQHLMQSIETAPESFAREEGVRSKRHLRQGFLRRFPYQVVFEVKQPEEILILAVAHTSRHPEYWRKRNSTEGDSF